LANEAGKYKLYGMKGPGERVDRVVLEGSTADPQLFLDVNGDEVDLTEEQVKALRASGHDIRRMGDSESSSEDASADDQANEGDSSGETEEQRKAGEQTPPGGETAPNVLRQPGRTKG
jgi:hypothetical protein